jgi:hypothetical protein
MRPLGRRAGKDLMSRFLEFFEDEKGHLSMPRLLMFLSFWPASIIMCRTQNENIYGWYISAYAAAYGMARIGAAMGGKNDKPTEPVVK